MTSISAPQSINPTDEMPGKPQLPIIRHYGKSGRSTAGIQEETAIIQTCPDCGKERTYRDDGRWECRRCNRLEPRPGQLNSYTSWQRRIPAIIEQLAAAPAEFIDRKTIEKLTGLQRTAAGELLKRLGASQVGKSMGIGKGKLVARLRDMQESPEFTWVEEHRARVSEAIDEEALLQRARKVTAPRPKLREFDAIPGVAIGDGVMTVSFTSPQDLVGKLFGFAQAILQEPDRFIQVADMDISQVSPFSV